MVFCEIFYVMKIVFYWKFRFFLSKMWVKQQFLQRKIVKI
jgi:hypothetical protein